MVKVRKMTVKRAVWIAIAIVVIYIGFVLFAGPNYPEIFTEKPTFGNPNAKVTIQEFSDLQCPACKAAHPTIQRIRDEFGDDISFQYFHFPLRAIHPFAQKAAEAVECANDQDAFFEYIDIAFASSPNLERSNLKRFAVDLGLDTESFNACLDSGAKRKIVEGDYRFGLVRKVQGTPTFIINNKRLDNWQYDNFKAAIEAELEE